MTKSEFEYDVHSEFNGLLFKVKGEGVSGSAKGKVYLIPQNSLSAFEFNPTGDAASFNNALQDQFLNLDYAIFKEGLIILASAH
jgi:hypothetical protein